MMDLESSAECVLGIDAGSVSVGLVVTDSRGTILDSYYAAHEGKPRQTLLAGIQSLGLRRAEMVCLTGSSLVLSHEVLAFDSVVCLISAVRRLHPRVGSLLFVGGERFGLVRFDGAGNYLDLRSSTSCAAGSGSFLDQQARRLGLADSSTLGRTALENPGPTPDIASRCSVFAKTDIIHAQAMGYTVAEICDGLCLGLARNIYSTVIRSGAAAIRGREILFCGGTAQNQALRCHLESVSSMSFLVDEMPHLYGAYGACLEGIRISRVDQNGRDGFELDTLFTGGGEQREYYYPPLELRPLPRASSGRTEPFFEETQVSSSGSSVETAIYAPIASLRDSGPVIMGIDIGSTSTKLAVLAETKQGPADRLLIGLYTQTGGQPVNAVRELFARLGEIGSRHNLSFEFSGVATTGAGRKFVGTFIGADLVVDEISAHARAAYEVDPRTDTIIEIGGQDAKFTTMRAGSVTFCQMNTVCAAGTGSFLEEQCARLDTPLADFESNAVGVPAPLTSDRCTVFMERDINACLGRGYSRREMLAASARSVCENYLSRVAVESSIGKHICFQGATARNGALVAAFQERLGRPIHVPPYCHIMGAIGAALCCSDDRKSEGLHPSRFRGLGAVGGSTPITIEECDFCTNRCRIRVAEVNGEKVGYGFACGREYSTKHFVPKRATFDLMRERGRVFTDAFALEKPASLPESTEVVGLPDALALHEDAPFWRLFFLSLGIRTVGPEMADLETGRASAGADFCAPMIELHSQIVRLSATTKWIFLPLSVGRHPAIRRPGASKGEKYCYYTQFSSSLAGLLADGQATLISPTFRGSDSDAKTITELTRALEPFKRSRKQIETAYRIAARATSVARDGLSRLFREEFDPRGRVNVLLIGRPYLALSSTLGKGIPQCFADLGVRTFYQDMVPPDSRITPDLDPLVDRFQWHYSVVMLRAADYCVRTEGLYPVLLTAFKCSPDSFFVEYFKRILERAGKPYLILQLDDLDSTVGYETRIEAAVRAFRNHSRLPHAAPKRAGTRPVYPAVPKVDHSIGGRTLLLPNWDPLSCPLLAANLRRVGIDARVLEEDHTVIRSAMRLNSGQCLPLNIIVEEFAHYVRSHSLDPAQTVLWIPRSELACNFSFFAPYMKSLLDRYGDGLQAASVYEGDVYHLEISPVVALRAYLAYLAGGMLRRLGCRTRPYESVPGATDAAIASAQAMLVRAFEGERPIGETLQDCTELFHQVSLREQPGTRPKVAIFGDLYVRDNEVFNHNLIHTIERAGGEAVTTPYNEYLKIIARAYFRSWAADRKFGTYLEFRALLQVVEGIERRFAGLLDGYHLPRLREFARDPDRELAAFHIRLDQEGESFDNALKILSLLRAHPDLSLFVQANPAFCCPSLVTEAMGDAIQRITGIPVVTITYDGTEDIKNDLIVPYLAYPRHT